MIVLGQYRAVLVGTWLVLLDTAWYEMVLGYYMAFMPLYIEKSGDSDVTIAGRTDGQANERTRKDRATQPMDHGRLR